MVKWTVTLAALVSFPMLATAQPPAPALPSLSTPDGLQAHLSEIMNLQRAQLQAALQGSRPALDNSRACYHEDKAYSEGALWTGPRGQVLRCQRGVTNLFSTSGSPAPVSLSWVPQS